MRSDLPGPYSLEALAAMPPPALFTTDAEVLKRRYVAWFEAATGRTLYPMQVEMLLIETLAYAMSVLGEEAQKAAQQHLVAFSDIDGLYRLGPNRSTPPLPAAKARCTIRFTIPTARPENVLIPARSRVSAGGAVIFATLAPAVIAAGATQVDVTAEAQVAGLSGNGLLAGQIAQMLDPVPGVTAANITDSAGGADAEDPELYRLRLANAFERISTGGSWAWYRETAMGVSSAIIDVAVVRPTPCVIQLFPLTAAGAAGVDLRNQVAATFNTATARDIRFGDDVFVLPPVAVLGNAALALRVRGAAPTIAQDAAAAANAVLLRWRQGLGGTIAPSDVEAAVKALPGVVDAELSGIAFQQLAQNEYLVATLAAPNVTVLA
jgi:phage-related baseplate assembly protein